MEEMRVPNAPLFRDPVHDAPADPMIIWNREERSWWMLYTARRADAESDRYEWLFGTQIGVASSVDGRSWLYRGELDLGIEPGMNTYWAPEVVWEDGVYHMFVTYSRGVSSRWHRDYYMAHLTATNMWEWHFEGFLDVGKPAFDATCQKLVNGNWRLWFRGNRETVCLESTDLYNWERVSCEGVVGPQEGPNVFRWKGAYWMIADTWRGQAVFRSEDATHWERRGLVLDTPGTRPYDQNYGQHAYVLRNADRAFIVYFINPKHNRDEKNGIRIGLEYDERRSLVQIAELECDGETITCDRSKPFDMDLQPEDAIVPVKTMRSIG
ncbi:MAG: glycosyl hydrolase [Clostridia bacterium]|nr:glycosyl hydrolase [Clostridia bacterium]